MNTITGSHPAFRTSDGAVHKTWNAARRHITEMNLLETIRSATPKAPMKQLISVRDAILRDWNISQKSAA